MAQVPNPAAGPEGQGASVQVPGAGGTIQRIYPNPAGDLKSRALEQLGQGLTRAGDLYGKTAALQASNDYLDQTNKILYGDPNKPQTGADGAPVMGPDGKPLPDTGFYGKSGQAAADAWPTVRQQLDSVRQGLRGNLYTLDSLNQFDEFTRRTQAYNEQRVGEHANREYKSWGSTTYDATLDKALGQVTLNPTDTVGLQLASDHAIAGAKGKAALAGFAPGSDGEALFVRTAQEKIISARTQALGALPSSTNPDGTPKTGPLAALAYLDTKEEILGADWAKLHNEFRTRADAESGAAAGLGELDKAKKAVSDGGSLPPGDPGLRPGYSYAGAASGHESGGNAGIVNNTPTPGHPQGSGASGLFQFLPGTARGVQAAHPELNLHGEWWHDASEEGVAMQKRAFDAFTSDNRAFLQKNGVEPTDKNAFMASFLGAAGATKFIKAAQANPNGNAAALFPTEAAANSGVFWHGGPGGATPRTLAQVYQLMTSRFSGQATIAPTNDVLGTSSAASFPSSVSGSAGSAPFAFDSAPTPAPSAAPPPAPEAPQPPTVSPAAPPAPAGASGPQSPTAPSTASPGAIPPGAEVPVPVIIPPVDPYANALKAVDDDSKMSPGQKEAAREAINERRKTDQLAYTDQERAQKMYREAREQASEKAEKEIIGDLTSDKPVNSVQTIGQNKALMPAAQLRMIEFAQKVNSGGGEASVPVSGATTVRLMQDIGRPFGDPQKVTSQGPIIDAFNAHQLNRPDFDWLSKQVQQAKSPEGEKLSAARSSFMKGVIPSIDKSSLGQVDAVGAQQLYRYNFDLDQQIEWYSEHGKNPFDLFNPGKPDYFADPKILAHYTTNAETAQKELAGQASGEGAAVAFPPYAPLVPGEPAPVSPLPPPAAAPKAPTAPALEKPTRREGESFRDYDERINAYMAAKAAVSREAFPGNLGGF